MIVRAEQDTTAPATMEVVLRLIQAPEVETSPSISAVVPSDFHARAHPAVPVASALESDVIAAAVITPEEAAPNAVALNVSSARSVPDAAVSGVAG